MAASDYLEQKILETALNNVAFPTWTNTYVSLHTVDVADDGSGAEVSEASYARVDCGAFTSMTAITDGQTENTAEIAFAQCTDAAGWGTVIAIGLWDAATGGNLLYWGGLTVDKLVSENDTFKIASGDLIVTVS